MSGFFDDGRRDEDALKAEELATLKQISHRFAEIAALLERARTVGDCREIDRKMDEAMGSVP